MPNPAARPFRRRRRRLRWRGLALPALVLLVLAEADGTAAAQIQIVEHGPVSAMLDAMTALNRDDSRRLAGFRVQLTSTTDRLRLEETEARFGNLYPGYPSDWVHEPPYYKLRTGAFVDRARATAFLYRVKRDFPSAYPALVRDIRPSELLIYR